MSEMIENRKVFNEDLRAKIMHIRDHIYVADLGEPFIDFVKSCGVAMAIDMIKSYYDIKYKKAKDNNEMPSSEERLSGIYETILHLGDLIGEDMVIDGNKEMSFVEKFEYYYGGKANIEFDKDQDIKGQDQTGSILCGCSRIEKLA